MSTSDLWSSDESYALSLYVSVLHSIFRGFTNLLKTVVHLKKIASFLEQRCIFLLDCSVVLYAFSILEAHHLTLNCGFNSLFHHFHGWPREMPSNNIWKINCKHLIRSLKKNHNPKVFSTGKEKENTFSLSCAPCSFIFYHIFPNAIPTSLPWIFPQTARNQE